ncbi:MAG TPA: hypothetical protein VIQ50_05020 [Xanthobacteraceae bacterium]
MHVRAGSKEAKFWLHDLATAVNIGFPRMNSAISFATCG